MTDDGLDHRPPTSGDPEEEQGDRGDETDPRDCFEQRAASGSNRSPGLAEKQCEEHEQHKTD